MLSELLNGHPMALKYLVPALMHFYIGKQTYSTNRVIFLTFDWEDQRSSRPAQVRNSMINSVRPALVALPIINQGRDLNRCSVRSYLCPIIKNLCNSSRNIAHVLGVVWDNPAHREALELQAR
jgi:hypothetical protein